MSPVTLFGFVIERLLGAVGPSAFPSFPHASGSLRPAGLPIGASTDGLTPATYFNVSIFQPTTSAVTPTAYPLNISLSVGFSPTPSYAIGQREMVELYTTVNAAMGALWGPMIDVDAMHGLANGSLSVGQWWLSGGGSGVGSGSLPTADADSAARLQQQLEATYTHLLDSVFSDSCRAAYASGQAGLYVGSVVVIPSKDDAFAASVQASAAAMSGASTVVGFLTSSFMGASDIQALGAFALHSCADPHTRAALGSYRILSPFAFWESFYGVIVGNLATVGALFGLQVIALLIAKFFFRKLSDWMVSMSLVFFPGLTLNVLFTLLTGSLFAAAVLAAGGDSTSSERAVGVVGLLIGATLPFTLAYCAFRFITRAYQSYSRDEWVAEKGYFVGGKHTDDDDDDGDYATRGVFSSKKTFKKWLLFFAIPEGVVYSPQTRRAFLAYISPYARAEALWPSYPTWGPIVVMVGGLTSSALSARTHRSGDAGGSTTFDDESAGDDSAANTGCVVLFGVASAAYFALAAVIIAARPFRSGLLNALEALGKLLNAAILACIAAAVYATASAATAADVSVFIGVAQVCLCVFRVGYTIFLSYFDYRLEKDNVGLSIVWSHIANTSQRGNRRKFGMGALFAGGAGGGGAEALEGLEGAASRREMAGDDGVVFVGSAAEEAAEAERLQQQQKKGGKGGGRKGLFLDPADSELTDMAVGSYVPPKLSGGGGGGGGGRGGNNAPRALLRESSNTVLLYENADAEAAVAEDDAIGAEYGQHTSKHGEESPSSASPTSSPLLGGGAASARGLGKPPLARQKGGGGARRGRTAVSEAPTVSDFVFSHDDGLLLGLDVDAAEGAIGGGEAAVEASGGPAAEAPSYADTFDPSDAIGPSSAAAVVVPSPAGGKPKKKKLVAVKSSNASPPLPAPSAGGDDFDLDIGEIDEMGAATPIVSAPIAASPAKKKAATAAKKRAPSVSAAPSPSPTAAAPAAPTAVVVRKRRAVSRKKSAGADEGFDDI